MKGKNVSISKSKKISKILSESEEDNQILFPDVIDVPDLKEDKTLPLLRILEIIQNENGTSDIYFEMPIQRNKVDVFLTYNGQKVDMLYQISSGFHHIKNIYTDLSLGESYELFYCNNNKKSIPLILNLNNG
ncbi:MAG: hypothetical protein ACM3O3_03730 [Syntrophothermus sp.]